MNMKDDADSFRAIAINSTVEELKTSMGVTVIPKRVLDSTHVTDPIEKCLWILEKKFQCRRLKYLNVERFTKPEMVINMLEAIGLPIILSMIGENSIFNHVVVAWRGKIIDFEVKTTYPVTRNNIIQICGPKNPFQKITRGVIICPSQKMKKAVHDMSDWGEKSIIKEYSHWFAS